jgi:hypothetical protein
MTTPTIVKLADTITNAVLKNGWSKAEVKLLKSDNTLYVTAAGTSAPCPGTRALTRNTNTMHIVFTHINGYVQVTEVAGRSRWFLSAEVECKIADLVRGMEDFSFLKNTTLPEYYPQPKEDIYW